MKMNQLSVLINCELILWPTNFRIDGGFFSLCSCLYCDLLSLNETL
jgi:hypothetical protein